MSCVLQVYNELARVVRSSTADFATSLKALKQIAEEKTDDHQSAGSETTEHLAKIKAVQTQKAKAEQLLQDSERQVF